MWKLLRREEKHQKLLVKPQQQSAAAAFSDEMSAKLAFRFTPRLSSEFWEFPWERLRGQHFLSILYTSGSRTVRKKLKGTSRVEINVTFQMKLCKISKIIYLMEICRKKMKRDTSLFPKSLVTETMLYSSICGQYIWWQYVLLFCTNFIEFDPLCVIRNFWSLLPHFWETKTHPSSSSYDILPSNILF